MADIQEIAAKLLESETDPEVLELKKLILKRIATESDIKASRIPAPLNITEVGGYYNLLMKLKKEDDKQAAIMLRQMLASVLGLPAQTPTD
jgi:hypothetical protein